MKDQKVKKNSKTIFKRWWFWVFITPVTLILIGIAIRIPHVLEEEKTLEAIERINAQVLTMRDVDGSRLPPRPNEERNNETIEGIDANNNSIRDDVELEIFERYPGKENEKLRAALLQYTIGLQLFLTEVFNSETLIATIHKGEKAYSCIGNSLPVPNRQTATEEEWTSFFAAQKNHANEVENYVLNTPRRINVHREKFEKHLTTYGSAEGGQENYCDVAL